MRRFRGDRRRLRATRRPSGCPRNHPLHSTGLIGTSNGRIGTVAGGESAFSPEIVSRSQTEVGPSSDPATSRVSKLTKRERQILRMIAKGMSRTEIADEISRSPMTVDNNRKSIMRKLRITDRVELARFAIAEGLVEV